MNDDQSQPDPALASKIADKLERDHSQPEPFLAPEVAKVLERSQINKYHVKTGHGVAAEDANILADRLRGKRVQVVGTNYAKDGPDRIVDGVPIQTKYCQTAQATIQEAFDSGTFRYQGQVLEVPSDQYDECVQLTRERITKGQVPGVSDQQKAESMIKRGDVTYKQARNIARAGNIDSILFDAKSQAITSFYMFGISFAVHFAKSKWNGEKTPKAIKASLINGIIAGGASLVTGVIAAQVLRTKARAVGVVAAQRGVRIVTATAAGKKAVKYLAHASLGKAVPWSAAAKHVSRLLRSNLITASVVVTVSTAPDAYRAAVARNISWKQFAKNFVVGASGIGVGAAGSMGGAAAGAAVGSLVPVVGTVLGGAIGGLAGAIAGGSLGSWGTKKALDRLVEDDAGRMLQLLQAAVEDLAVDYLLSEAEVAAVTAKINDTVNPKWLRSMYQAGVSPGTDPDRQAFAYNAFNEACLEIAKKREKVLPPPPEVLQAAIDELAEEVLRPEDWSTVDSANSPSEAASEEEAK